MAYLVAATDERPTAADLRAFLQGKLPEYMVPAAFVVLEALPLTPNGKLDRQALPAPDRQPAAQGYLAPRTAAEEALADIWAEVLGLERVGVQDNFFELGGDSILAIQVVARASRSGLRLSPRLLFQHQTVAELAQAASLARPVQAEQGPVTGAAPLTPIQHWFFEHDPPAAPPLQPGPAVRRAAPRGPRPPGTGPGPPGGAPRRLAAALRPPRATAGSNSHAEPGGQTGRPRCSRSICPSCPWKNSGPPWSSVAADTQAGLDLGNGPLLRAVLFHLGAGQADRLLLVIHHLVVDGVSWRVLLEDLLTAYEQLARRQPVQLPPKTTSWQYWAQRLSEHARSEALRQELPYWLDEARRQVPPLPVDQVEGDSSAGAAETVVVTLGEEQTRALLQEVPAVYRTHINDVLLTALAQAYARWSGQGALLVDLEGHGREELFDDVDLSRTVGWFTTLYPVLLQVPPGSGPGQALQAVKEQLRAVPNRGIGYGLLRYLSGDEELRQRLRRAAGGGGVLQLPGAGGTGPARSGRADAGR